MTVARGSASPRARNAPSRPVGTAEEKTRSTPSIVSPSAVPVTSTIASSPASSWKVTVSMSRRWTRASASA